MRDVELKRQRDKDLYDVYKKVLEQNQYTKMADIIDVVIHSPAKQFYISWREAKLLLLRIMKGWNLIKIHPLSKKRILDIYNRYIEFINTHPNSTKSFSDIVLIIIAQPAPQFYLGKEMACKIIYKQRKLEKEELRKRYKR